MDIWPIDWPTSVNVTDADQYDPYHVMLAEEAAAKSLRMLTLYQVGGLPITVMPVTTGCCHPFTGGQFGNSYLPFYPILLESGRYANCFCGAGCGCTDRPFVYLKAPVGRVDQVTISGVTVPPSAYHIENGNRLVRLDDGTWPSCMGANFTVTYLNGYEVDVYGQFIGGLLAVEFLTLLTNPAQCRLPAGTESVTRQGVSITITRGMFPDMVTGIPEVDLYLKQFNPHGLKSLPQVYSPDIPTPNQITWQP